MTALQFRQFFLDLFGSRYIYRMETDLQQLRQDFEQRLIEKDQVIATLRAEKASLEGKIIVFENVVLPHLSRIGAEVVSSRKPKPLRPSWDSSEVPSMKSSWQIEQEKHEQHLQELPDAGTDVPVVTTPS